MEWLKGKKTYIVAILAGLVVMAQQAGFVTPEQAVAITGVLGAMGLATLRAGISAE